MSKLKKMKKFKKKILTNKIICDLIKMSIEIKYFNKRRIIQMIVRTITKKLNNGHANGSAD